MEVSGDLKNLWAPNPAFLVGGGPSINQVDVSRFRERGVVSMATNQAAAHVPTRACVLMSQPYKYHHALYLDPALMKFVPQHYFDHGILAKIEGQFRSTDVIVRQCPNVWAICDLPERPYTSEVGMLLLYFLGVRRVYLLGIDLHGNADGGRYGYPDVWEDRWPQQRWDRQIERLQHRAMSLDLTVFSCSLTSRAGFPYVPFDVAIEDCRNGIKEPLDTMHYNANSVTKTQSKKNPKWNPPWAG